MYIQGLSSHVLPAVCPNVPLSEPHSSVGSFADLGTGGRLFDPRLGQYSFRELMTIISPGLIPLSLLSVVSTMVMWEISH